MFILILTQHADWSTDTNPAPHTSKPYPRRIAKAILQKMIWIFLNQVFSDLRMSSENDLDFLGSGIF